MNVYGYVSGDPINNIDPDGRIVVNLIRAGVGAILGGYSAYQQGGSMVQRALIGGVSNLLGGKAAFNAVNGLLGNLLSQATSPCVSGFSDINYMQALAASAMGAYNLGSKNTPNLLSNSSIAGTTATNQTITTAIVGAF